MINKIIALALVLVMLTTIFTACGTKKEDEEKEANPAVETMGDGTAKEEPSEESTSEVSDETEETSEEAKEETEATTTETTTKKNTGSGSSSNTPSTTKAPGTTKAPSTTNVPTTTKAPTATEAKSEYLTYEEVKECVAKAEAYAKSLGLIIDRDITIYGYEWNGVHYDVSYAHGADTSLDLTKEKFYESLKYDIERYYNQGGVHMNIYVALGDDLRYLGLSTTNYGEGTRYVAFVCY